MLLPRSLRANASDTIIINNIPFNRSVLSHYNYTIYPNGTLSNVSDCYLVFGNYRPTMSNHSSLNSTVWDGTINGTTCYAPIRSLGPHASLGMVFALLFAITFILTMGNLRKHGRRLLSPLNRRYASSGPGRRFKWFWMLLVAVCGVVACFMGIDVDRDYLQTTPLMLQGVFYTSLTPALMAVVWEGVRHWYVPPCPKHHLPGYTLKHSKLIDTGPQHKNASPTPQTPDTSQAPTSPRNRHSGFHSSSTSSPCSPSSSPSPGNGALFSARIVRSSKYCSPSPSPRIAGSRRRVSRL